MKPYPTFKPMLAGKTPADLSKLNYPVMASRKLDGIRCLIQNGIPVSRKLEKIRNRHVFSSLTDLPEGLDGELMVCGGFNSVQSAIMSRDGEPDFKYHVFDQMSADPFNTRWVRAVELIGTNSFVVPVAQKLIENEEELLAFEAECLAAGDEGVMVRDPEGLYKQGRSTTKEGGLLKLKRFETDEAEVIGFVERTHNDNEATKDALGHTKRSSAKAGKRPAGDLGTLICRTPDGAEFEIGSGFSAQQKVDFWQSRDQLIGRLVSYKHQAPPGGRQPGQVPRGPAVFRGFRHEDDLS